MTASQQPQTGREQIGTVQKKVHGYSARCGFDRCGWFKEAIGTPGDAERLLQGHAEIVHPPVIRVYR